MHRSRGEDRRLDRDQIGQHNAGALQRTTDEEQQRTGWTELTEAVFCFHVDLSAFLEQQFDDVLLAPFRCHVQGRDVLLEDNDGSCVRIVDEEEQESGVDRANQTC